MNYIKLIIAATPELQDEIIYHLTELGFDGFEQNEQALEAYVPEQVFEEAAVTDLLATFQLTFTAAPLPQQNWNQVWESNFEPVIIDDFVGIRAHFHAPIQQVQHELLITPKMSFGTGHHATTHMMVQQMRSIHFTGKQVFDFGTGTGVLAILAEKLGASKVYAIDNDQWSIDNATENAGNNTTNHIEFELANDASGQELYDIILANINKNVILDNLKHLDNQLVDGGVLFLSGLLVEDESDILAACKNFNLNHQFTQNRDKWICIGLIKQV
jgi:ribosomal protein L11 methyltransferase